MKRIFLSAAVIVAIGATAFTVKSHAFGQTQVYCLTAGDVTGVSVCPGTPLDDIIVDNSGSFANPCASGLNPHVFNGVSNCQDVLNIDKFIQTAPGK